MINIEQAVIVEGKYDKIRLENFIDGLIIPTDGFGIFNDTEKKRFIKKLSEERGILVLTDSDAAGFKIRSYIASFCPPERVFHAYVPDILGKEKRKDKPSKEGKLGVEGIDDSVIINAISKLGLKASKGKAENRKKADTALLYEYGLCGRENSSEKRRELCEKLGLPKRMTNSALIKFINSCGMYDEFIAAATQAKENA